MGAYGQRRGSSSSLLVLFSILVLLPLALARTCGVKGRLKEGAYRSQDAIQSDFKTCKYLCSIKKGGDGTGYPCYAFGYNAVTGTCNVYGLPLSTMGFVKDDTSNNSFTDARCIGPPPKCNPNYSGNLVINGGFDRSNTGLGPWKSGGTAKVAEGAGIGGSNALFCPGNCKMNFFRTDLCDQALYSLSLSYKFVRAKSGGFPGVGPRFDIYFADMGTNANNYDTDSFEDGKWMTFNAIAKNDFGYNLPELYFDSHGSVWHLYVDNVRVEPVSSLSELGPNLLPNGGFDAHSNAHNIKPWKYNNVYGGQANYSVTAPGLRGQSGKKKFEWTGELTNQPGFFPSAGMELTQLQLPTELGKTYQIDFDYVSANIPTNVIPTRLISFGPSNFADDQRRNQTAQEAATVKHFRRQTTIISRSKAVLDLQFYTTQVDTVTKGVHVGLDNFQLREVLS